MLDRYGYLFKRKAKSKYISRAGFNFEHCSSFYLSITTSWETRRSEWKKAEKKYGSHDRVDSPRSILKEAIASIVDPDSISGVHEAYTDIRGLSYHPMNPTGHF